MIFQNCLTTILLAIAVSLLFDASICYANPGISVRVTQNGFNYATEVALEKFYEEFKDAQIPDMEKEGKLYYKIYNIRVAALSKPTGHVTLAPGEGLKWGVNINNFNINGNWRYFKKLLFFKVRDSGSLDVSLSNTRAEVTILPTMASNGSLNIKATGCSCSTDLDIHVSRWYLRLILSFFEGKLRSKLEDKICEKAISAINNKVAPKLTQYPLTKTVAKDYVLDYSLESNPIINSGYLQTNHKAMVYYKGDTRPIPFSPKSFPTLYENNKMIYFIISNYLFETWFFAAHRNNVLQYNILAQKFRGIKPEMLQTTCPNSFCIGTVFPEFAEHFPNSTIQLSFTTSDRPRMNFLPNRIQIVVPTVLKFDIIQSNAAAVNAFSIHLGLSIEAEAKLIDNDFFLSLRNSSFTMGEVSGLFKYNFNVQPFNKVLKQIIDGFIPYIQDAVSQKMPIILPEKTLIDKPEFRVVDNAIILGADLKIGEI